MNPHFTLFVHDLCIEAHIGALHEECGRRQTLIIDVEAEIAPPLADALAATPDYRAIRTCAQNLANDGHVVLLETYAQRLADVCLALNGIQAVAIRIRKPAALAPAMAGVRIAAQRSLS